MSTPNIHHQLKQLRRKLKKLKLEVKKTYKDSNKDNKQMGKLLLRDIKSQIRAINKVEEQAFSLRNIFGMTKDIIRAYKDISEDGIIEDAEIMNTIVELGDKYIDDGTVLDQSLAAAKLILKDGKITAIEVAQQVFKLLGNNSVHPLLKSIADNGNQILEDDKVEWMELIAGVLSVMTNFDKNELLQDIGTSGQLVLADGAIEPMELILQIVTVADKHVDDGSLLDQSLAGAKAILEDGEISVLEVATQVCKVLAKGTHPSLLNSIATQGMDILADEKIELMEVIAGVLALMGDHSKNELMQDIASGGQLVLADGTISPMELIQQVVAVANKHIQDGSLLDQSLESAHTILKDGVISPIEVAKAVFKLISRHVDHPLLKSIAANGSKIVADDKLEILEIISGVLSVTAEHSQEDILRNLAKSGQVILKDGTVNAEEVIEAVLVFSTQHLDLEIIIENGGDALQPVIMVQEQVSDFLDTYINGKEKELIRINYEVPRNKWGRLIYSFNFDFDLQAKMSAQPKSNKNITLNVDVDHTDFIKGTMGLDLSFVIPIVEESVSFELKMGISATFYAALKSALNMSIESNYIQGTLPSAVMDTTLDMDILFYVPESIVSSWNAAASWSSYINPISSEFKHKVGRYALIRLVIPAYSMGFDLNNGAYTSKSLGSFSVRKGKDIDAFIKKIESYLPWN